MLGDLQKLLQLIIYQFGMIAPYWAAGLLIGSFISVFTSGSIKKAVYIISRDKTDILALPIAALLGAASPICMYGTVPLIAALGNENVPEHHLAAFMVSSILINPNLFILSLSLGVPLALLRLSLSLLAGIAAGWLIKLFYKNRSFFSFEGFSSNKKETSSCSSIKTYLGDLHRAIIKTTPYFLVGIVLTALYEQFFPKEIMVSLFSSNKGFGVLLAASLGVPVYICGGGTIPLLRAWLYSGMSMGSAIAFMITGPATKLTNLGAVKIVLGMRNFIYYIIFNIVFAITAGLLTDFFF